MISAIFCAWAWEVGLLPVFEIWSVIHFRANFESLR